MKGEKIMKGRITFGDCTVTPIKEKATSAPANVQTQPAPSKPIEIGELLKKQGTKEQETEAYCKEHTFLCGLKKLDDKVHRFLVGD